MASELEMNEETLGNLIKRAKKGDTDAAIEVRRRYEDQPGKFHELYVPSLDRWAILRILQQLLGDNALTKEAFFAQFEAMRDELAGPNPSVLERMLVDRLMVCWVDAHVSDLKAASDGGSIRLKEHFGRAASRANSRLMKAFKTLAQVRRVKLQVLLKVGTEQAAPRAAFGMDVATHLPASQRMEMSA